jgi:DNA (cytosine-5)-methyltransferase 1
MKFIDFFSGIGGFRLGMEMAGNECVGHCEIDKFADKSYRAMHDVKDGEWYANDIRAVEPGDLPEADCYCGGFPCQAFSVAGKRGGFEDTRGTLFFEVMRLAAVRKPKYLFMENVAGLLSHDGGKTFGTILNTLGELGYWYEYQVLNSKDIYGPQNRPRVFIIGHRGEYSGQKVFPIRKRLSFNSRKRAADFRYDEGLRIRGDGSTPCLMSSHTLSNISKSIILVDENRYLTPKEHFRLQGFPDTYFEKAATVCTDTQLYKQAGNSVTVNVIHEIAKRMEG